MSSASSARATPKSFARPPTPRPPTSSLPLDHVGAVARPLLYREAEAPGQCKAVLAERGRLLAIAGDLSGLLGAAFVGGPKKHRVIAGPEPEASEDCQALVDLANQGVLKPVIDRRFEFEKLVDAYRVVDSGRKKGSVVVALDPRSGER